MKSVPVAVVAIALLSGCARYGDALTAPSAPVSRISAASTSYVQASASADLMEVQAGQLALQRSSSAQMRSLAQAIIADHSMLSSQLANAAQASGIAYPVAGLMPEHSAQLAPLQTARPEEFDSSYRNFVVLAHLRELDTHQQYAAAGDQPPLRSHAQAAASAIQMRLSQAQSLVIAPPSYYRPPSHRRAGERG